MKINATKNTPFVELSPEGLMIIQGRSIMDDPTTFFAPILHWISECKAPIFTLEVRMEYMNTSSSKLILYLLKTIKEYYNTRNIFVKWYYESDDEDMLDMGKDFEAITRIPIDFYEMQVDEG